ncbi:MAG TPA: serine/threonine-protein kinase [Ktedonobacteraceae bacterium]|nr:serine/threonine-protein kinase [Ktedonobacteraceae bacterium]
MSTEPVRRLGKYELRGRLGHGGMAEVWKAYDTQLQRYVAIKLLHANLQADPNFVTRFQQEAQVIASLRHPNIVQIHDFQVSQPPESDSPTPYMVMDYIEDRTLADYIANTSAQGKIPSPVEIVTLFTSISLAIDFAHQKGMIHRDIKPANILLDKHNTTHNPMGEPILTDFGLAKLLGVSAGAITAAQPGTPLYTSPEQVRGYPGNERSDLYSLGVILYEIVTGVPPFRGDSPAAVLAQHLNATPTSPVLINPNIPPALTMVVMTALAKDPNARFARAAIMTAAIAEALNVPLPESLGQPAYPPDMRNMPTYFHASTSTSGGVTPMTATRSDSGTAMPVYATPQLTPTASVSWQPLQTPASSRTALAGSPPPNISSPSPAQAAQIAADPTPPIIPAPPSSQPARRWKGMYTVLVALVILALLGSGVGAYFAFFHQNQAPVAPVSVGQAYFLSSGQYNFSSAQGIADEMQIQLHDIPAAAPGKSYYAWLLGDEHPHVEQDANQPPLKITLPLLIGKLNVVQGKITLLYTAPDNDNLISVASRMLITQQDSNSTPSFPATDRSTWRYYAAIPQAPYGPKPQLSALDHIRHLFYKETVLPVLGLYGGLDAWLFRNTEKVLEWSISAQSDYHPLASDIDQGAIHSLVVRILDYLDGSPNVSIDVPGGAIDADRTISQVALLSVVPAQKNLADVTHNPPGYLDHVQLHLQGVVGAPDATPQMRAVANKIILELQNAKIWLGQVRADAQQLVTMDANQLAQPSSLTLLNNMLTNATYAYTGQLNPQTDQASAGVTQAHYDIQQLAALTFTTQLPQNI